ncbi:MAG: hypothetical protein V4722_04950 [Bacteroidota bacterium]
MKQFFQNVQSLLGLFILVSFTMIACNQYADGSKKVAYGKNSVYYKGDATEADAKKLGDYLRAGGKYFDDSNECSVMVEKHNGAFTAKLVVDSAKIKSAADLKDDTYNFIAGELSRDVYEGKAITVEVTDGNFKTLKTYYAKGS